MLVYRYDFNDKIEHKKTHLYVLLIILILLSGFRYRMAPDTVAYMSNFENEIIPLSQLSMKNFIDTKYQPF